MNRSYYGEIISSKIFYKFMIYHNYLKVKIINFLFGIFNVSWKYQYLYLQAINLFFLITMHGIYSFLLDCSHSFYQVFDKKVIRQVFSLILISKQCI